MSTREDLVRQNFADHEAALTDKPAEVADDWIPLWSRIKQVATDQPDVRPDIEPERFAQILSHKKRPSTTDLAQIADAFGVTVPWLVTGADGDAGVLALLRREAKHVQREMAAADPQAGLADLKRRLKNPPPFVGYLVAGANFTPPKRTKTSWLYQPPSLFHGLGDAEVERDGFQAMAPDDPPKAIFKVTVTFERVEGGSRGR